MESAVPRVVHRALFMGTIQTKRDGWGKMAKEAAQTTYNLENAGREAAELVRGNFAMTDDRDHSLLFVERKIYSSTSGFQTSVERSIADEPKKKANYKGT